MKRVLFWPEPPRRCNKITHALHDLGVGWTLDPDLPYDLAILWHYGTRREGLAGELVDTVASVDVPIINLGGEDVSKSRVGEVHEHVFGYSAHVDPLRHEGVCVEKNEQQCAKDARLVQCPYKPRPGYVYMRQIDTRGDTGCFEDLRVPIFRQDIPFCWSKLKSAPFARPERVVLHKNPRDVFAQDELTSLVRFCEAFRTELAELDVLRGRDGRIYVVDVNNVAGTISGAPTKQTRDWMMRTWADALHWNFLRKEVCV